MCDFFIKTKTILSVKYRKVNLVKKKKLVSKTSWFDWKKFSQFLRKKVQFIIECFIRLKKLKISGPRKSWNLNEPSHFGELNNSRREKCSSAKRFGKHLIISYSTFFTIRHVGKCGVQWHCPSISKNWLIGRSVSHDNFMLFSLFPKKEITLYLISVFLLVFCVVI